MKPNEINLSPSFLSKVYEKGYDYAVGEKLGMFPREDTQAMSDGRLIHALIAEKLGGEKAKIAISPYDNYRTKEARTWRDSQPDDTFILTEEKLKTINEVAERAVNHPVIKPQLENVKVEQIIEKQVNGFNVKGIIDVEIIKPDSKDVIDWKFVSGMNFDGFTKKALYMNYDLQAATYKFLADATLVSFVTIESQPPYRIKVHECNESFLQSGADKFNTAFKILKQAKWRQPNFDIEEVGELMSWEHLG